MNQQTKTAVPCKTARSPRAAFMATAAVALLGAVTGLDRPALAQNIDVSTLPPREGVQLTIYNSEDLTLVRETRHVTVRQGMNSLQFSWANTLIDPTSVQLRLLDKLDKEKPLELVDTVYPHDRPQQLLWNLRSGFAGDAAVEISYFTSGLSWSADYVGVVDPDETGMRFDGHVTIVNNSGEDYGGAQVRMVVGTINLVEKIADLAKRGLADQSAVDELRAGVKYRALKSEVREAARAPMLDAMSGGAGGTLGAPKEIVKEGLSEYFIFTVPGTETIRNGWSKRLRLFASERGTSVPLRIEYRYRPQEYGDALVRLFLLRNDEKSHLGASPLPDGAVRLYRDNGHDGLGVVASLATKYVPVGQEFEFNLGVDPEVILERLRLRSFRDDFWFKGRDPDRFFSPTKGDRIEPVYEVAGWNDHEERVERVRNYRSKPIAVEFRFPIDGDAQFVSRLDPTLHDFQSPQFKATIAPATTTDLPWALIQKRGINEKQRSVTLVAGGSS
ncbi:MAG: hypothetical protein U0575_08920 [Phycisphaerales bacterium]